MGSAGSRAAVSRSARSFLRIVPTAVVGVQPARPDYGWRVLLAADPAGLCTPSSDIVPVRNAGGLELTAAGAQEGEPDGSEEQGCEEQEGAVLEDGAHDDIVVGAQVAVEASEEGVQLGEVAGRIQREEEDDNHNDGVTGGEEWALPGTGRVKLTEAGVGTPHLASRRISDGTKGKHPLAPAVTVLR
jgi:hypothetical protein